MLFDCVTGNSNMKKITILLTIAFAFTTSAFACHKGEKGKNAAQPAPAKAEDGARTEKRAKIASSDTRSSKDELVGDTNHDGELDEKEIAALYAKAGMEDRQGKIVSQVHVGKPHGVVRFNNDNAQQRALAAQMKAANAAAAAQKSRQTADSKKAKHAKAPTKTVAKA